MKLKPRYGYWDVTSYPIGGCFKRAGDDGLIITDVKRLDPSTLGRMGCDMVGMAEGRKVAFCSSYCEPLAV